MRFNGFVQTPTFFVKVSWRILSDSEPDMMMRCNLGFLFDHSSAFPFSSDSIDVRVTLVCLHGFASGMGPKVS